VSATGRGKDRVELDVYETPAYCTHRLCEALPLPPAGRYLEYTAGSGRIINASRRYLPGARWTAIEIRESCRGALAALGAEAFIGDFFRVTDRHRFLLTEADVLWGNPPFLTEVREEIIRRLVERSRVDAWVIALLTMGTLASERRNAWMRNRAPDTYIIPNRPGFRLEGTDAETYAWFVWPPFGHQRARGELVVLPHTPPEEREQGEEHQ